MADGMNVPPGIPPDQYGDFINAQRQQQLANALLQGSLSPVGVQNPETVKGLYVQPRVGAVQGLSKIAEALLGRSATNKAIQQQTALQQSLNQAYAPGGQVTPGTPLQIAPQGSGSNTDTSDQGVQPLVQRAPGQSLAQTVQGTQPTVSPVNPRNPQGLPADVVRQLAMTDPAKYAAMLQGPEAVQLARIAGVGPQQAAGAALSKATQTEVRPGATVMDPISGRTMVGADPSKGEFYAVGPDGQVHAYPITNDAQIQAWRAGMQTGAQQANTPREIPMGGGATRLGYPPTPPALQGQGAPQGNPAGPAPLAGPATAPPVAPPAQPGATPPAAAPPLPPRPAPPPAPVAPRASVPAAPPSITAQADQRLWQTVPRLNIPNTPGQGSDKYTMDNLAAASAKKAALTDQYGSEARLADQQLQYNQRALQVLPQADVGPMSEWLTANRQRLIQAGVPESMIPASGTITPTLELNKYLKNAALQGARSIYGNRMTQNEVELQTNEMSPSAHMTASAIQSLIAQNNIQSQYQKQRAADFNTYVNQRGGDPQQFEAWYDAHRPLTRFASQAQTPPAAIQRLQANPQLLPDFQAKYGWNPTQ